MNIAALASSTDLPLAPTRVAEADAADRLTTRLLERLTYDVGGRPERASARDWFVAAALVVRDEIMPEWRRSNDRAVAGDAKQVSYLSMEFLIGRLLSDAMGNLGITEAMRAALAQYGVDLAAVCAEEPDAALGNGGLGRLAACFMESMASVGVPAYGYGIRYEFGLFRQAVVDGCQTEVPEPWLLFGNPWEIERSSIVYDVGFGGSVHVERDETDQEKSVWHPEEVVRAVAFDTPVVGWCGKQVNTLRLWSAQASDPLQLHEFNRGNHVGAVSNSGRAEAISRVLYPGDETPEGQELRLRQEFFFASASLQDILQRHVRVRGDLSTLPQHVAIQLNDTHPAIGIPELMRLLIDRHRLGWEEAWSISRGVFSYTNHTLLPEALERWPVGLVERLLPRHMQIIYRINAEHLGRAAQLKDVGSHLIATVSLIDETHGRRVRMGNLAFIGSHTINGVSALHSKLVRESLFADLDRLYPGRIVNKTNGIAFRRWLHYANPALTAILVDVLGKRVLSDPRCLQEIAYRAGDPSLQERLVDQRRLAKQALVRKIKDRTGIAVNPNALFDVQIKRIHEYKRQLLNILHAVALYQAIVAEPHRAWQPRMKLFAGKAAAGYHAAKQIIRLANDVARIVNADPRTQGLLQVVFLPDYNVSLAEAIIPAADLSEQISTAGMEASGTGNMKLMLNGALTIGTLDGANVEIRDNVGADNIFIFGLTVDEVERRRARGSACAQDAPWSMALTNAVNAIGSGAFSPDDVDRYRDLVSGLRYSDWFFVAADFDSYCSTQVLVDKAWTEPATWWRKSILNIAGAAWFSSDRAIAEYARDIWKIPVS